MTAENDQVKFRELKSTISAKNQEIATLQQELSRNHSQQADIQRELTKLESEFFTNDQQKESAIRKQEAVLNKVNNELDRLRQEIFAVKRGAGGAFAGTDRAENEILTLQREMDKEQKKLSMFENKQREVSASDKRKFADVESILEKTEKLLGNLQAESGRLRSEIAAAKQEQARAYAAANRQQPGAKSEVQLRAEDSRRQIELTNPKVRQAEADLRQLDRDLGQLQDEQAKLEKLFEDLGGKSN